MREVIPHPGDLSPRQARLRGGQLRVQGLHGLADLKPPDPYGITHQVVRERTPTDVGTDGLDCCDVVVEARPVVSTHNAIRSGSACLRTPSLSPVVGMRSTSIPTIASSSA